jgi:uncharacterized membrane protein (UPF0127 family)
MKFVSIRNLSNPQTRPIQARYCSSFFCRLRGLMFTQNIGQYEGLLMVQAKADRIESSIHMLFMAYDLAVIWLDEQYRVVDVKFCQKWRPAYFPAGSAKFVLETHVDRLKDFTVGDVLAVKS